MKGLQIVLGRIFYHVKNKDWDNVLIIGGGEGKGKSHLGLTVMDWWLTQLYGKCTLEDAWRIALDTKQFVSSLKDLKRFEIIDYDEAGDLSSLRMMNKFNYSVTNSYQVIRSENLCSLIILPDVFYLNPFFSTRRARGYIEVYERGRFAYWDRPRLQRMISLNANLKIKKSMRVEPLFRDTFSPYNGPLLEGYQNRKQEKTKLIRDQLYNKIVTEEEESDQLVKALINAKELVGITKTAQIFEVSKQTIYNRIEVFKKNRGV